jgi:hypothetical protein
VKKASSFNIESLLLEAWCLEVHWSLVLGAWNLARHNMPANLVAVTPRRVPLQK